MNPTLTIELASLQLDNYVIGEQLNPREPKIAADGTLYIGSGTAIPWAYTPASNGAANEALNQIANDLQSLRDICATDADLEAEVAEIQTTIDALASASLSDAALATALAPIQTAIGLLVSDDEAVELAITAIQNSVASLDANYATDLQLATAIAQVVVMMPIRSATMPTSPAIGTRWIELDGAGSEIYDQPWAWRNGEWQLERLYSTGTGSGRISNNAAPRMDLSFLPALPGLAGYRLVRADIKWNLEGAGNWTTKLRKFSNAATIVDWVAGPAIAATAKKTDVTPIVVPANSLVPLTLCAIEFNLTKGPLSPPDSAFTLSCQWTAVRA